MARFGGLDVLANIAGVGNSKSAHDTSDEDFEYWINANLSSTFRLCRDALPELRKRRGAILNMASGLAIVGMAKQAAYTSAKAGIAGLTRQMAAEYGPEGIRVNAVAPGLIETPATAHRLANDADYRNSNIGSMPLMRAGQPAEVAGAAAFLQRRRELRDRPHPIGRRGPDVDPSAAHLKACVSSPSRRLAYAIRLIDPPSG